MVKQTTKTKQNKAEKGAVTPARRPTCVRCIEDFPVADEPAQWRMGQMRPLSKAPLKVRTQFAASSMEGRAYLCGNCYFDLTDED